MFKIDKGISLDDCSNAGPRISWPWKDMDVGDSVLFDDDLMGKKAQTNCHVYGKLSGKKFSSRMTNEGMRIWRVA